MQDLLINITLKVNPNTFIKDPESSLLGKRIIQGGIDLLVEIGFEQFTFKRLAERINSTEASVYRYFESKHKFLVYLTSYYWAWTDFRMLIGLTNIHSAEERLHIAIKILTEKIQEDRSISHINEEKLHSIVITDSSKAYLTKNVDQENKEGVFHNYKNVVQRISNIIQEIEPSYAYPHMLISTVIEGAHHQRFFADHLPRLTDIRKGEDSIVQFYTDMVFNCLKQAKKNQNTA